MLQTVQPFGELYNYDRKTLIGCMVANGDDLTSGRHYYNSKQISLAEISLICAHRKALALIANDPDTRDSDWSLILEDDATLNPDAAIEARALSEAATGATNPIRGHPQAGFLYYGFCSGKCLNVSQSGTFGSNCYGYCTHAYAVTKHSAARIFDQMYSLRNNGSLIRNSLNLNYSQIDQAYVAHFKPAFLQATSRQKLPSASVVGFNYRSPEVSTHLGLLYQRDKLMSDRSGSNLGMDKPFQPLKCFAMIPQGGVGELMFQYAAMLGFCHRLGYETDACPHFRIEHSTDMFTREVVTSVLHGLGIQNPVTCKRNGTLPVVFRETDHREELRHLRAIAVSISATDTAVLEPPTPTMTTPTPTTFDVNLTRSQLTHLNLKFNPPDGAILDGQFLSFRYFDLIRCGIRQRFKVSPRLANKAHTWLSKQRFNATVTSKEAVVCVLRDLDWPEGSAYYNAALRHFHTLERSLSVLNFNVDSKLMQRSSGTLPTAKLKLRSLDSHDRNGMSRKEIRVVVEDELVLMKAASRCANLVIGRTTIGWWAAYLADENVGVVAPKHFSGEESSEQLLLEDYYPPTWTFL